MYSLLFNNVKSNSFNFAERAQCSRITAAKVEKGDPTVSMGTYLRILFALQLADDIEMIAKNDPIGRDLQDLKERKRASR